MNALIVDFMPVLSARLPATEVLLKSANLVLHSTVSRVVLHGSRGLAGGYRPDSDIDLSLVVDDLSELSQAERERLLHEITAITFQHWQANIEVDLAVIFDKRRCELKCFDQEQWDEQFCAPGGTDWAVQRTYQLRVARKYILTLAGLFDYLTNLRLLWPMHYYHAQSAAKGTACVVDVIPAHAEFLGGGDAVN